MDTYSDKIHIGRQKVRGGPVKLQKHYRNDLIADYIKKGFTQTDIARFFGISKTRVQEILRVHFPKLYKDIKRYYPTRKGVGEKIIRNKKIYILHKKGYNLSVIALVFNLRSGRIYQIVKREIARRMKEKVYKIAIR